MLGGTGAFLCVMAAGVNLVAHCPPEMAGVAGAWQQVMAQIGGSIFLAVQAALNGTSIASWDRDRRVFWFTIAAFVVNGIAYAVFYRHPESLEVEHDKTRRRIAAKELQ